MIETIRQGLQAEGIIVSIAKLCRWFDVPRRTVYYKPVKSAPKLNPQCVAPIKTLIEESPLFGCRMIAHLLGFKKHTVQRVFQLMGWQVRKRPIGFRTQIQALFAIGGHQAQRALVDRPMLCRIWAGRDGWATLALVIDCHTRELLGWHLSRSGSKACTAGSALEHALIARFGTSGRVPASFLLRSDNGMAWSSLSKAIRLWCAVWIAPRVHHAPHCPQQNGMIERVIRTLKEQCALWHRFETI